MRPSILRTLLAPIFELRAHRQKKIDELMTKTPLPKMTRAVAGNVLKTTYLPNEHKGDLVQFEVEDTAIRRLRRKQ